VQAAFPEPLRGPLDAVLRSSPLLETFGIELLEWAPGAARAALAPLEGHANLGGAVHGGVLFALADAAFEAASNGYGRVCVALETTCHYCSPAPLDEAVLAEATELSRSRRTGVYRIEARGAGGELRASYTALAFRTERWHLGPERWPESWRGAV